MQEQAYLNTQHQALDGSATIIYEGVAHEIHAGEQFCFAKGGLHAVNATEKFKMALLLTL